MSLEPLRDAYFPTYFSLCSTNIDKIPNSCIYSVTYCKAKGLSWSWWYLNLQLPMQSVPIVSCDLESHSGDKTIFDKVCQSLTAGRWFSPASPGTPVSSTNKTDRHNTTEILMKVVLNTISQSNKPTPVIAPSSNLKNHLLKNGFMEILVTNVFIFGHGNQFTKSSINNEIKSFL